MEKKNGHSFAISTSLRFKPNDDSENEIEINKNLLSPFSSILSPHHDQLKCYNDACVGTVDQFRKGYNCTFFRLWTDREWEDIHIVWTAKCI
mmetsp:Transcript_25356/g.37936  ORF Transcript_25356/g.37936 Transcript_25356/m.37936 type:complete len:92 (+) Transcript_25356:73-348(+)